MHVLFYLRFLKLFPLSFVYLSWQVGFEIWFAKRMWFHWVQLSPLNHGMQREMIKWFQKIDAMISIEDLRIRRCNPCGFFFFEWPPLEKTYEWEDTSSKLGFFRYQKVSIPTPGCDRRSLQMFEYVNWKTWLELRWKSVDQKTFFFPSNLEEYGYHLGHTSSRSSSRQFYSFQER